MATSSKQQAVFLDLQGTLGGEGLGDVFDFSFFPCAIPAIRRVNEIGLLAIVVTNQSHIAKGDFTLADFENRMADLRCQLIEAGARLDGVYCCPHSHLDDCTCRKPLTGMLVDAQRDNNLELAECYVVGDVGAWDIALARAAGCKAVLVRTGLGESSLTQYRHTWANLEPDFVADDVLEAASWIAHREGGPPNP